MNTKLIRMHFAFILTISFSQQPAIAVVTPTFQLDKICNDAALIVVGQVTSVRELARTTVQFGNRAVPGRAMAADIRVDDVLKGSWSSRSSLTCRFTITDEFMGWRSVSPSYRVFFLTADLGLANPYHPSVPAVPGNQINGKSVLEQVISQLSGVVESTAAATEERREAVFALGSSADPAAIEALGRVSKVKDLTLRLSVAAALLKHNDISTLELAVDTLLRPAPTLPDDLLHNLSYAIFEGVSDDRAAPALTRLLRTGNVESRRAAASALMHTGSTSAIEPLLAGINDSDFEVRYYSAVGLAEITGQTDWRPNMDVFASNQEKYVEHWYQWSKARAGGPHNQLQKR
jgi:hypothetical protein